MNERIPAQRLQHAFHPAVAAWFAATFPGATEAQLHAWPLIQAGRATLVAAPTDAGKTLTAFLAAIDALVRDGMCRSGKRGWARIGAAARGQGAGDAAPRRRHVFDALQ